MAKNLKFIIFGAVFLVVVIAVLIIFLGIGTKPPKKAPVILEMWGIDKTETYQAIFGGFVKDYPNIQIKYSQKKKETYEKELLEAFLNQKAPDIFMIENTWLPRYIDRVYPAPASVLTLKEYQSIVIGGPAEEFLKDNKILGMPIYADTLGLFYNDNILKSAGIALPPKNWDEFNATVKTVTKKDQAFNISLSGAALGLAENVNYSADIFELLLFQTGLNIFDDKGQVAFDQRLNIDGKTFAAAENALAFYVNFANPAKDVYSWNSGFANSLESFIQGKTAMFFGYSSDIENIKKLAPKFNFKTSIFPEPKDSGFKTNLTKFFAPVVWSNSRHPLEAWQFLKFLSAPVINEYYTDQFKRPTTILSLIDKQRGNSSAELEPFIEQVLTAKNFYQKDNFEVENIFKSMISKASMETASYDKIIQEGVKELERLMKE